MDHALCDLDDYCIAGHSGPCGPVQRSSVTYTKTEYVMQRLMQVGLIMGIAISSSATAYAACCCIGCIEVNGATCTQTGCPTSLTTGPCGVQVFLQSSCTGSGQCGKACGIATCMNNLTWFGCGSASGSSCCARWQQNTSCPCHDCCMGWICGCLRSCGTRVGGPICGSFGTGCPCQGQGAVSLTADESYVYCTQPAA
jgi:hypothetical protein